MKSDERRELMETLPLVSPMHVIGHADLLVVAPHPDDESLGCGGLLAWAAASGHSPRVLFITDGEQSHPGSLIYPPPRLGRLRQSEAREAGLALGLMPDALTFMSMPDAGMASLDETQRQTLFSRVRDWVALSEQAAVCIPARSDTHGDHIATHDLVKAALKDCSRVRLFAYPVWTWLADAVSSPPALSGRRVDTSPYRRLKQKAIAAHRSQHGLVVHDATEPFVLPRALLEAAELSYEVLFDVDL